MDEFLSSSLLHMWLKSLVLFAGSVLDNSSKAAAELSLGTVADAVVATDSFPNISTHATSANNAVLTTNESLVLDAGDFISI